MIVLHLTPDGLRRAAAWQRLEDDAPVPADGPALVSLARWREAPAVRDHGPGIGVWLAVGEAWPDDLPAPAVLALPFPAFNDGRSYSLARRLRRAGFDGALRAYGDVLVDQVRFMARVGFSELEMPDDTDDAAVARALAAYADVYQPAADPVAPIGWRRAAAGAEGRAAE